MRQLSAVDALMVYGETSRTPMHVSPFFIYDQSTAPNGLVRFKDILKVFESKLANAPTLRQRLLRVPLDLDEPYWVDDPHFDIEHHIRHLALPKPGDRRQLSILLARIHSYPMDLNRPPWDAFVIEGLDNVDGVPPGSFAMLLRIHHASIDGHSGHALLAVIHDLQPIAASDADVPAWTPRPMPTRHNLLKRAYFNLLTKPRKLVTVASDVFPAIKRVRDIKRQFPGEDRKVPRTRFGGVISPHRVLIAITFDMAGLRAVRRVIAEATVNDAVVTVVTGALRRYLIAHNDLPEASMTTLMPINVRTEAERDKPGNMIALASLDMHSNIADPLERLRAIHDSAIYSKAYQNAIGARIMADVAESIPAGIVSVGARVAASAGVMKVPANTIVTNVPGPQVPLYLAGAKVVELQAIGILLDGLGLFHAVNSYCGRVAFTVLSDRKMMPDPAFYEQCLRESYDELTSALGFRAPPKAVAPVKKAAPKRKAKTPA